MFPQGGATPNLSMPGTPIGNPESMVDQIASSIGKERLVSNVSSAFASFALACIAVGLYALLAEMVLRRKREIGVRVALGASRSEIVAMIMSGVVRLSIIGLAAGIPVALLIGTVLHKALDRIPPVGWGAFSTALATSRLPF
jgi:ABC-type antimicrobial peptide transport system permease subunit